MTKKNIILFTGPNALFLEKELGQWKDIFIQKHGEINLISSRSDDRDSKMTMNECLTPGFMWSARMIIVHDFPRSTSKSVDAKIKEQTETLEELMEANIDTIPETNFVLLIQPKPNKQTRFYKTFSQQITIKDYPEATNAQIRNHIEDGLKIDANAMYELISRTESDLRQIDAYKKKFQLYKPDTKITKKDIETYVTQDLESNIFQLLDGILNKKRGSFTQFSNLAQTSNIYALYAGLMTNIRKIIYACILLDQWIWPKQIASSLKIPPYTISKNSHLVNNKNQLIALYEWLLAHEYEAKTWLHPSTSSDDSFSQLIWSQILHYISS